MIDWKKVVTATQSYCIRMEDKESEFEKLMKDIIKEEDEKDKLIIKGKYLGGY